MEDYKSISRLPYQTLGGKNFASIVPENANIFLQQEFSFFRQTNQRFPQNLVFRSPNLPYECPVDETECNCIGDIDCFNMGSAHVCKGQLHDCANRPGYKCCDRT
jgi:hypothetical protein